MATPNDNAPAASSPPPAAPQQTGPSPAPQQSAPPAAAVAPPPLAALPSLDDPAPRAPPEPSTPPARASAEPPPLLDGIIRVKVPAARIEPFLAKTALFRGCDKAILVKVAALVQGLECADGSELVTAGKVNDGLGILFSGKATMLLPSSGGELLPVETIEPGDHFGEVGALLGEKSPYFVIASEPSRLLWLSSEHAQGMLSRVGPFGEAVAKRLAQRLTSLCAVEHPGSPEYMTEIEAQLLETLDPGNDPAARAAAPEPAEEPEDARAIPWAELRDYDLQPSVLSMVPTKLVRLHRLLPVKLEGNRLTVAMVAPRDSAALAELKRTLQTVDLRVVAIGLEDFNQAIVRLKLTDVGPSSGARSAPRMNPDQFVFETVTEQERETARDARAVGDDVIKLVNRIIAAGLDREASDIHIEPTAQQPRVRFRVNGLLQDWTEAVPQSVSHKSLAARIKILAGLDITERRVPQDGRIGINSGRREIDLRVSTLPANRGEKIALRILEGAGSTRPLEQIFFEPATLTAIRRALNRPYGGIVIAGPTGSGKTSSLYSILNERKVTRPDTNVLMVEDPIEYRLSGVVQVQVNTSVGLSFASVLRSMLRQDPDVIVLGEMRDTETAVLALEAAMTGHLLLTSLHANNSIAALQRLENLGCSRALIAQSVALILVQRLVRKLCTACRKLDPPPPALLESLVARRIVDKSEQLLPRAVGCDACGGTGYVGRAVVVESLQLTDAIREALTSGRSLAEVQQLAAQGRALLPFLDYSKFLLHRQIISASEVLLSLAD
jgi:type II secretory ATPase GspE/PulE/Tfp pilus assembly ATPase PilB-like protein